MLFRLSLCILYAFAYACLSYVQESACGSEFFHVSASVHLYFICVWTFCASLSASCCLRVCLWACVCLGVCTYKSFSRHDCLFPPSLHTCVCIFNAKDRIQETEERIIICPFCLLFSLVFLHCRCFFRQFGEQRCLPTVTWKVFDVISESRKCVHTIGWLGE